MGILKRRNLSAQILNDLTNFRISDCRVLIPPFVVLWLSYEDLAVKIRCGLAQTGQKQNGLILQAPGLTND